MSGVAVVDVKRSDELLGMFPEEILYREGNTEYESMTVPETGETPERKVGLEWDNPDYYLVGLERGEQPSGASGQNTVLKCDVVALEAERSAEGIDELGVDVDRLLEQDGRTVYTSEFYSRKPDPEEVARDAVDVFERYRGRGYGPGVAFPPEGREELVEVDPIW